MKMNRTPAATRSSMTPAGIVAALFACCAGVLVAGVSATKAQTLEERLPLCMTCHGEKGQSETELVPSLGGQPAIYVLIQLYMFRHDLRTAPPMNDMAKGLSDTDLQKLADVVAKLPAPQPAPGGDQARLSRAAGLITQHRCAFCHNNLAGAESVPRIASQREDYLLKSLREYKSGERTEYQPVMVEVVAPLKDEDFVDLAHYLAHTAVR
jgi:cytochrome c553